MYDLYEHKFSFFSSFHIEIEIYTYIMEIVVWIMNHI